MVGSRTSLYLAALTTCLLTPQRAIAEAPCPLPPTYVCQRTTAPIIIDGRADEADWKAATPLSPLRDIEGRAIPHTTTIRMLWDDTHLYIHADMQEPHLWATQTQRDSIIYHDPDFEVFIDPDGDGLNYIELEINALGTTWDLFLPRPYRNNDNLVLHDWDIKGLRHAIALNGTLNNAADIDKSWSVELAIPWRSITSHASLPRADQAPSPGSTMRMNFSRVNWQVQPDPTSPCGYSKRTDKQGIPLPESNHVWAPTGVINIHMPEHWGQVSFSSTPVGTWEAVPLNPDEPLRLALFRFYNTQLAYRNRHGHFATTASELAEAGCNQWGADNLALLTPDHFVLQTISDRTGSRWSINSEGHLHSTPPAYYRPHIYLWTHGDDQPENTDLWEQRFADYATAGVDTVIISGSVENITTQVARARKAGLRAIAWCWALNRPGDPIALKHPDWHAVSREGKSCFTESDRPYVGYYQFLCPNNPKVREHLKSIVRQKACIPGVEAVQLDYMRLPDVILPRGLWDTYGLVMDSELPPYDFCYCERCRTLFRNQYGRDIAPDPTADAEWREFRLQSIADLTNELADEARLYNVQAACAVFPTPQIASQLVRQDWSRFRLDLALPMNYFSFYDEQPSWLERVVKEAIQQTKSRIPMAPGLHLPDAPPADLPAQLDRLYHSGARSIALFSNAELTPEHARALRRWLNTFSATPPATPTDTTAP